MVNDGTEFKFETRADRLSACWTTLQYPISSFRIYTNK